MNQKMRIGLAVLVLLVMVSAVVAFSPAGAAIRAKLLCATEDGNCVEGWNGTDLALYSDSGTTNTFNVEGSVGAGVFAVATAVGTATPALVVDSAGVSNILEVRDAATPVFEVRNGGAIVTTGNQTYSGGLTVNNWAIVSAPTAIATSTPAAVVDSAGVSAILEIRDAATPVARFANGGGLTVISGGVSLSDGDLTVADDLKITAQTAITVTDGAAFTPTGTYQPIQAAGEVTPTITAGTAGDIVVIVNISNQTINIADSGTFQGSGAVALGQYDTLTVIYDGTATAWVELAQADN